MDGPPAENPPSLAPHPLAGVPLAHLADRFATFGLNTPYLLDESFRRAWAVSSVPLRPLVERKTPEMLRCDWKAHVCCRAASRALRVGGDLVECGVNYGLLSKTVAEYVGLRDRQELRFWLYDTFTGIPREQMLPEEAAGLAGWHNANNHTGDAHEIARHRFSPYPNAVLVRGRVPDTLAEQAPEITAEFFWSRMPAGAVLLLDDYGHAGHEAQMVAFQGFAAARGQMILALPTGQGLLVKA